METNLEQVKAAMPSTYAFASEVEGQVPPNPDGTKQAFILIAIAVIGLLIQLYRCWKDRQKATQICNQPAFRHRLMLKYAVRRAMGREDYRKSGQGVVQAFLQAGGDVTPEKISAILEEHPDGVV